MISLKRRWRVLRRVLPELQRDALAFAPALFAASFDARGLKTETPGLAGARPSPLHFALAAKLKTPSLLSHQTGRSLATCMLVLFEDGLARVLVEPAEAIGNSLVRRIADRCAAASLLYAKLGLPARFEVLKPGALDSATLARLYALGAIRCGRPSKALLDAMKQAPIEPKARAAWVPHAPTSYCRVRLLLGASPELEAPKVDPFAEMNVLRLELTRALRRAPLAERQAFRLQLRREQLPGGVPASLLPALREVFSDAMRRRAPALEPVISEGGVTLTLPDGARFASARTLLQARVRALSLANALWGSAPEAWAQGPQWKKLAQRLAAAPSARTVVLFALGHDGNALVLQLKPGREPRVRELEPARTLRRVISAAAAGHQVEIAPCSELQELEAMRLSQIAWRAAATASTSEPLTIDHDGRTLLFHQGRFRSFATASFLARPRKAVALEAKGAPTKSTAALGPAVECEARLEAEVAVLRYRSKGWSFEERVSLDAIASHLQGSMAICSGHFEHPRFVLHLDDRLAKRLKSGRAQTAPPCVIEIRGDLLRGLQLVHAGQTFTTRELRAVAETVLSAWPVGVRGQLDIRSVVIGVGGMHAEAIACLYARSLIARRLSTHITALVDRTSFHGALNEAVKRVDTWGEG